MADQPSTEEAVLTPVAAPPGPPPIPRARPESHPLAAILLYLIFVFVGAALIAPRLHASVLYLYEVNQSWRWLAEQPFHRYVNRCMLLLALVGLPTLIKALRISSWCEVGFRFGRRHWTEAIQGFAWGFAMLAVGAALAISFQGIVWDTDHTAQEWQKYFRNTVITAVLVGVIEEVLFRGALFTGLRRRFSFQGAALASAVLYALCHFFQRPENPGFVQWFSGLVTLAQMLKGFTELHSLFPAFLNLTLIGLLLALALERTRSLLFSIGLHAGLIFWSKTLMFVTDPLPTGPSPLWGSDKAIDSWANSVMLLLTYFILRFTLPAQWTKSE